MSQKLRRPILLVGVTGSPTTAVGTEKCKEGGAARTPAGRVSPLVSDIVRRRLPESKAPIRAIAKMHMAQAKLITELLVLFSNP